MPTVGISSVTTGGDADTVFHAFNQALQTHNLAALKATLCADVRGGLSSITQTDLDEVNSVTELIVPSASGSDVGKIAINVTDDSGTQSQDLDVTVVNEGRSCVQNLTLSAGGSSSSPSALSS